MNYHKLLQRQISKFLPEDLLLSSEVQRFLEVVNNSYELYERDKAMANRAAQISEEEYIEINTQLKNEALTKSLSIQQLKQSFFEISGQEIDENSDDLLEIVQFLTNEINNRKSIEIKLEEYKKFSEDILNNIPADIAVFDKNHNYIFINPKGVANTELREWLIGKNDFDYCELKGTDTTLAIERRKKFEECLVKKAKIEFIDTHKSKKSEYQYEHILRNFYPFFENDELKFVIGYGVDITEKIEFEKRLTQAIIKTQEDERIEVGSELHDNICQILTGVSMGISMIRKSIPEANSYWIQYCTENIKLALIEAENLSHRLSPIFQEEIYFSESIVKLVTDYNKALNYKLDLNIDSSIADTIINTEIQQNIYRILQEELRNIYKYANATSIKIGLKIFENKVVLTTKDNGIGFELETVKKGNGMVNIKRRVEILQGELDIISSAGKGCEIIVKIPIASKE